MQCIFACRFLLCVGVFFLSMRIFQKLFQVIIVPFFLAMTYFTIITHLYSSVQVFIISFDESRYEIVCIICSPRNDELFLRLVIIQSNWYTWESGLLVFKVDMVQLHKHLSKRHKKGGNIAFHLHSNWFLALLCVHKPHMSTSAKAESDK